jgi:hypothetical protein
MNAGAFIWYNSDDRKLIRNDFANVGGNKGQDAGNYYYHPGPK